jgi:cation diffusion facilitator family transporter
MREKVNFIEKADRLAGLTTIILFGFGIIQIIMGETISKSVALTANGIDCMGDGFVSAVVWIGLKFFKKPANQKFNYGYYKMENLASIAAAVVMMLLAGYILFRSYNQLIDPHEVELPILGAIVAMLAAVTAISIGAYKYKKSKKSKLGSVKLEAFNTIKDGTASGLTVVALIFDYYGYYIADAIVGFIIAGVIVTIGFAAIKESSYMLVDACDNECIDKSYVIKTIAEEVPGVEKAHIVRLRRSGPIHQGAMEIKVSHEMTVKEFNSIKKKILNKVQQQFPDVERLTITSMDQEED